MNKAVHALVYVILVIAAAALYFEMNLYKKRAMQEDRHQVLVDYISKIAHTIEKADAPKPTTVPEARKDVSPVEAKLIEVPEMENVLEDYAVQLEEANLETFKFGSTEKAQLRKVYAEMNGEPIADPANPGSFQMEGPGTAAEILGQLFDRAKAQQAKLNSTRAELATARTKIESLVNDYNKLKPEGRQDKPTIEELKQKLADAEAAKAAAEEQVTKTKAQVEELNAEVTSLKDEVTSAKDETDAVKEDLAKSQKLVDQLKTLLQKQQQPVAAQAASGGVSAAQVTAGNKGKIVAVNNDGMFAVVEMTDAAMNELIGEERKNGLPLIEMALRRTGFKGPSGEYIGRIRLRQAISGKNLVIVDVLGDWKQSDIKVGDVVFAE
jgi:peptidoglycan hydrolase CwlO-like protein